MIKNAVKGASGVWADLGSGEGAFTLALADITKQKAEIFSIDRDPSRLAKQKKTFQLMFPKIAVHYLTGDFTKSLNLPPLDGILMANSLHYLKDQVSFLTQIKKYLKPGGSLILVEYNTDSGNMWVPYPISFASFKKIALQSGFAKPILISRIQSDFLNEIYAALTEVFLVL